MGRAGHIRVPVLELHGQTPKLWGHGWLQGEIPVLREMFLAQGSRGWCWNKLRREQDGVVWKLLPKNNDAFFSCWGLLLASS